MCDDKKKGENIAKEALFIWRNLLGGGTAHLDLY